MFPLFQPLDNHRYVTFFHHQNATGLLREAGIYIYIYNFIIIDRFCCSDAKTRQAHQLTSINLELKLLNLRQSKNVKKHDGEAIFIVEK